jgi:hypothetical protein
MGPLKPSRAGSNFLNGRSNYAASFRGYLPASPFVPTQAALHHSFYPPREEITYRAEKNVADNLAHSLSQVLHKCQLI